MQRTLTALIGFPLVVVLLIYGNNHVVDIGFAIVAILAIREYFNGFSKKMKPLREIGYITALLIAFIHLVSTEQLFTIILVSIPVLMAVMFVRAIITEMKISVNDIAITLLGICYIVRIYYVFTIIAWYRKWEIPNMVYIHHCMGHRHLCVLDRS